MYFVLRIITGPRVKICRQEKCYKPHVVYATDCSKAVVLVLFLFCVLLWFLHEAFHVESYFAPCSRVVISVLFCIVITSLVRELVYMLLVHLYVYLACAMFVSDVSKCTNETHPVLEGICPSVARVK